MNSARCDLFEEEFKRTVPSQGRRGSSFDARMVIALYENAWRGKEREEQARRPLSNGVALVGRA